MSGTAVRGEALFRFVVLADTHIEPEPGTGPEPRSNGRARQAVALVNGLRPAFVAHLGDIVHPVPALPAFEAAVSAARRILAGLGAPLHSTPGNHDIGDKPSPWMPAKTARAEWAELYARRFQPPFRAFDHGGCRFVLLAAPLLGTGTAAESAQRVWLERTLALADGRRLFLFTHYPPYLLAADEPGHYDNLDEPARSWLLDLLRRHRVEALFAGHVHNLFYGRHGDSEIYVAPATAFVRRDYSELFRVDPAPEFGRDDAAKLGVLEVTVHEAGHRVRFVRLDEPPVAVARAGPPRASLGVDLRHPWCEIVALPYNPPTDAFQRRVVRNDYPLWALWELGIDLVRLPLADLEDAAVRARMLAAGARGLRFVLLAAGIPSAAAFELILAHADLVRAIELVVPQDGLGAAVQALAAQRRVSLPALVLAPLRSSADSLRGGAILTHDLGHGHTLEALRAGLDPLAAPALRELFDGVAVHVPWSLDPWEGLASVAALRGTLSYHLSATIGLTPATPDADLRDDRAIAGRVATAAFAAWAHALDGVLLDSFMDVDRGYHVRNGLVDRRCNPRLAGRVLARLGAALPPPAAAGGETQPLPGLRCLLATGAGRLAALLVPAAEGGVALEELELPHRGTAPPRTGHALDLASGEAVELELVPRASGEATRLRLARRVAIEAPWLLLAP